MIKTGKVIFRAMFSNNLLMPHKYLDVDVSFIVVLIKASSLLLSSLLAPFYILRTTINVITKN